MSYESVNLKPSVFFLSWQVDFVFAAFLCMQADLP
jgi:hypothetical protein